MPFILGSAFKLISCVGCAAVSVISLPVIIWNAGSRSTPLLNSLNTVVDQVKTIPTESMDGMDKKLKEEYVQFGDKAKGYKEGHEKNIETLNEGLKVAEGVNKFRQTHQKDINYYAFEFGHLAGEAIKKVPEMIRDTFYESTMDGQDMQLLSFQKLADIAKSPKLNDFMEGMTTAMKKHSSVFSSFNSQDAQGVIQILKETPRSGIDKLLQDVKTNSENLESESSSYCNATKLMMHLLVGKTNIENITSQITKLQSQLDALKDSLSSVLTNGITIDTLKNQLTSISNNQRIKDPCAQAS